MPPAAPLAASSNLIAPEHGQYRRIPDAKLSTKGFL